MDKNLVEKIQLSDLPYKYRKWKSLYEYRQTILFLPSLMRDKVAEQLMACDYMLSLELWLKPTSVIAKRHKRIFVQQIASVYEGIIDFFLDKKIKNLHEESILAKEISSKNFVEYRRFNKSIDLMSSIEAISPEGKEYLIKICEVRNYIHLSKNERGEIIKWLDENSSNEIRSKLNIFIEHIKNKK
jgi:hypothetical protein